jgi:hypothetical protein
LDPATGAGPGPDSDPDAVAGVEDALVPLLCTEGTEGAEGWGVGLALLTGVGGTVWSGSESWG